AAIQPEGVQRTILESLAMARPVVVSDLAAGPDIVQAPPAVPGERVTGLRFAAGGDGGLAPAPGRLLSMAGAARRASGRRGGAWGGEGGGGGRCPPRHSGESDARRLRGSYRKGAPAPLTCVRFVPILVYVWNLRPVARLQLRRARPCTSVSTA